MWGGGMFLYYSYICMVKTMSFENVGGGREPRAGKDWLTHIPVNNTKKSSTYPAWESLNGHQATTTMLSAVHQQMEDIERQSQHLHFQHVIQITNAHTPTKEVLAWQQQMKHMHIAQNRPTSTDQRHWPTNATTHNPPSTDQYQYLLTRTNGLQLTNAQPTNIIDLPMPATNTNTNTTVRNPSSTNQCTMANKWGR